MLESKKELYLILVILAIGFSLRFCVSYVAPFSRDDYVHLERVNEISLSRKNFNLLHQGANYHPPLSLYVTKLSIFLFGDSNIGFRMVRTSISLLCLIVLYLLVRSGYGKETAILALVLMSFDQFKIAWARIENEPELIFFTTLAVYFFWRAINENKGKFMLLTGVFAALGYLSKEPGILLMPAFFIYLLCSSDTRGWFKRKETYLGFVIFVMMISPNVYWNIVNFGDGYFVRNYYLLTHHKGIAFTPFALYFAELIGLYVYDYLFCIDYIHGCLFALHIVTGIVLFGGVILSLSRWKSKFSRLMLTYFFVVFLAIMLFRDYSIIGTYWWASLSIFPAAVLTSDKLISLGRRYIFFRYFTTAFVTYTFLWAIRVTYYVISVAGTVPPFQPGKLPL